MLKSRLQDAEASAASARGELSAAEAKVKKMHAAAAIAASRAESKLKQLQVSGPNRQQPCAGLDTECGADDSLGRQAMLGLCRKARSAQSATRPQREKLEALHAQVDQLEACLQRASEQSLRPGRQGLAPVFRAQSARIGVGDATGSCSELAQEPSNEHTGVGIQDRSAYQRVYPDLPVFEQVLQAAADLSVEQVHVLSLQGSHCLPQAWAEAEGNFRLWCSLYSITLSPWARVSRCQVCGVEVSEARCGGVRGAELN